MMMEAATFYEEGSLGGENPSEGAAVETAEDAIEAGLVGGIAGGAAAVGEQAAPVAEREQPEPDPEPRGTRSQARPYVVVERVEFEGEDGVYFTELARVDARNAKNALRKAFKDHIRDDEVHHLAAVPASQWTAEPVQRSVRSVESVQIG